MGMLTYIPSTIASAMPNGNLPIVKNGFIVDDPHYPTNIGKLGEWFIDGVVVVGKSIIEFIANNGIELDGIFTIVCICGIFIIMAGFRKLGTKITSGSIIGYIVCKVVSEVCK